MADSQGFFKAHILYYSDRLAYFKIIASKKYCQYVVQQRFIRGLKYIPKTNFPTSLRTPWLTSGGCFSTYRAVVTSHIIYFIMIFLLFALIMIVLICYSDRDEFLRRQGYRMGRGG